MYSGVVPLLDETCLVQNAFSIVGILTSALLLNLALGADVAPPKLERVSHIFVMRRPLNRQPLNSIGAFAHTALLLHTDQGSTYVLEYQRDSKAHLTSGVQKEIVENRKKGIANIRMAGWANGRVSEFYWERQLIGDPVPGNWTPQELQQRMQDSMKGYSVLKMEHCHTAQQRLRSELGLIRPTGRIALDFEAR